jgi:ABC-type uncharacterized transport system ATPase subunit
VSLRGEAAALGIAELDPSELVTVGHLDRSRVLAIRSAVVTRSDGRRALDGVDLDVYAGEIVGVAGVEGNGQVELADVLASLLPLDEGRVEVAGREVLTGRAGAMGAAGVALIPEDRHDAGCVLDLSVADNLTLRGLAEGQPLRRVDRAAVRGEAQRLIEEYDISCSGPDAPMRSLSGGNQQRVVVARELAGSPSVVVAAQPTRGLDVGAIEFIGDRLRAAADGGAGVLLISSELEEILHLSDRILVMHGGRIVGGMARAEADLERIGLLMGGVSSNPGTGGT